MVPISFTIDPQLGQLVASSGITLPQPGHLLSRSIGTPYCNLNGEIIIFAFLDNDKFAVDELACQLASCLAVKLAG
jgi:hypothetical protein